MSVNVVSCHYYLNRRTMSRYATALGVMVCLLSWGSAFNSQILDLPVRVAFWCLASVLIVGQSLFLWHFLSRRFAINELTRFLVGIIAAFIAAALFTLELNALKSLSVSPYPPEAFWTSLSCFMLPAVAASVLVSHTSGPPPLKTSSIKTPEQTTQSGPREISEQVYWPAYVPEWIKSQDHYLELHYEGSSILIRARMKDAEARFAENIGMRVHRSWWVRNDLLIHTERSGRDFSIVASDGTRIPISRKQQHRVLEQYDKS